MKTQTRGERPDYEVLVVGAGFGGIGMGIRLRNAGIDNFIILEQAGDIGGTWRDNTYPGVAVDVSSFMYSFSFEQNPNWSRAYAPGEELKAYADHCADKYRLRSKIRLNTKVTGSEFDENQHLWRVSLDSGGILTTRYLILGVGALTQPKLPDIPGVSDFAGKTMHTARWDHDCDLDGKRVAVIGTGATAVQVVPAIAKAVARLDVYQRTPIWCGPKPDLLIPDLLKAVFRWVPLAQSSARMAVSAATEAVMTLGIVHHKQVPLLVEKIESACIAHLHKQVPDPELREKLTPKYGFGCKRPSFSNDYYATFTRDNVELVTDSIQRITTDGIVTADGCRREIDTLILATGFKVFERGNTPPFPVYGRGGVEIGQWWDQNRYQAYQGIALPLMPNAFSITGPYGFTGASYFQLIENQTRHALRCIESARRRKATYIAVSQDAHDRYFRWALSRTSDTVFYNSCAGSNSYYFDKHGDTPLLRPSSAVSAWWDSRNFSLKDYRFESLSTLRVTGSPPVDVEASA
ncbi:NAD(P)/FAD-dependent oxidoreductase [Nocardia sp. XZ_19_385]|uniref:flavin-containing monooxygenase n=1 Tax=Nocardia sp. XZ_19_385 TaxID=2769488 RepID=UPI00188E765F|nr:NAD(P)/FAD-dependent oxidoreductase [Nocardia sp. XZ_19_385]